MTVEAMSGLPMQAGGAVAAAAGRTALWALSAYIRAPLRNTAVLALVSLSAMAGANALYHQAHHHPAPLFGTFDAAPVVKITPKPVAPVMPIARPKGLTQPVSDETTGSLGGSTPTTGKAISTDDVVALQQGLKALQFFDGTVDGLFGPRTAKAIKAFEVKAGRTPRGLLTPQIIAMVKGTPLPAPVEQVAAPTAERATVQVASNTVTTPTVASTPASPNLVLALADNLKPLPAPVPLGGAPASQVQVAMVDPAQTMSDPAVQSDATETGLDAPVQALPNAVTKRTVATIAVHAAPAADDQPMPSAIDPSADVPPVTDGTDIATDSKTIAAVQRGLNSLGFLHGEITGVADEATAKAIRNFEVYFNYDVTGRITRELVNVLAQNGAVI